MFNKKTRRLSPGIHTAAVTPFRRGEPDLKAFNRLLSDQLSSRVAGVVVLGTTGEAPTVTEKERGEIVSAAAGLLSGKKELTVGCGSNDTAKTVRSVREAASQGADFALVVAPYYNRPSQRGLLRHFMTVAEESPVPVIVYNVPSRTGVDISAETLEILSAHENIVACKEASADMQSVTGKLTVGLDFFCGNDALLCQFLASGAAGGICVCSNIEPDRTCEIAEAAASGDAAKARSLFYSLYPLIKALGCDTNPVPIKALMSAAGYMTDEVRPPLLPLDGGKKAALLYAAAEAGIYMDQGE